MENSISDSYLRTAVSAVNRAGEIILSNLGRLGRGDIETKQASDFVTKVDRLSEEVVLRTIRDEFPSHAFLAEESQRAETAEEYRWIVDPLDGTTNYIHGYPMFSVSIALQHEAKTVLGVVFDPLREELYHAISGGGAYLNGHLIRVSDSSAMEKSLIATGFPFRKKGSLDIYLRAFKALFNEVSDIRRAGSAALDLAYIAAGRLEGFFELNLSPWDIAAGDLLIREAGGVVTDFGGGDEYLSTGNIVAGNAPVQAEILRVISGIFKGSLER